LIRRAWRWLMAGPADDPARMARALLAAVYLAWVGQGLFLQRQFHYVHVPEVILSLFLFAANRWPIPFAVILWQALTSGLMLVAGSTPDHPEWRREIYLWHKHFEQHEPWYPDFMARRVSLDDSDILWWH